MTESHLKSYHLLNLKPLKVCQKTKRKQKKCCYISAIEEILNDNSKFSKFDINAGKEINHVVTLEKRITSELKLLKYKEIIDKTTQKSIKPVGSRPGISYGLGKIQKETRNGIPPFCPILSAIGTPT